LSKETYVIAKDGEGEELEVVRAICNKCFHYELVSPEDAERINDLNFKCPLCWTPPGVHKIVKTYEQCGNCGQVMGPDRLCYCPEDNKPLMTFTHSSKELKNPATTRLEREIEEGKMQTFERKTVRTAKQQALDREIRMDKNLQKIAEQGEKNVQK